MICPLLALLVLILVGCANCPIIDNEESIDDLKTWFMKNEPNYNVSSIHKNEDTYVVLTTFEPPGVDGYYTLVKVYIVERTEKSYAIEATKEGYAAGSSGFSANLLSANGMQILFGDIGDSYYDFQLDGMKNVAFQEMNVSLQDGTSISCSIANQSPYIVVLDANAVIGDITFKAEKDEIHYSDFYRECLIASPSDV